MGIYILLSILLLALWIFIDYLLAKEFSCIAEEKGYSPKKYFWWSFWFGISGYLLVIALPDRRGVIVKSELPKL